MACCESCGVTPPPGLLDPPGGPSALADPVAAAVAGAAPSSGGVAEHELRSPTVLTHNTQPGEEVRLFVFHCGLLRLSLHDCPLACTCALHM